MSFGAGGARHGALASRQGSKVRKSAARRRLRRRTRRRRGHTQSRGRSPTRCPRACASTTTADADDDDDATKIERRHPLVDRARNGACVREESVPFNCEAADLLSQLDRLPLRRPHRARPARSGRKGGGQVGRRLGGGGLARGVGGRARGHELVDLGA